MVLGGWGLGEQVDQIQHLRYTWQVLDHLSSLLSSRQTI